MTTRSTPEGGGVLIARQPVFDRDLVVVAYQLVGQATDLADVFGELDPSTATGRLLNDVFLEMDIEALTGGRPVLVPATADLLLAGALDPLPPALSTIVLDAAAPADERVAAALGGLRERGHRVGLGEVREGDARLGALPADFAAVTAGPDPAKVRRDAAAARRAGLPLLLTGVDEEADFRLARSLEAEELTGGFFRTSTLVRGRRLDASRASHLRLLALVHAEELDLDALEGAIKHDVALSVKFLNYANAAFFGWKGRIESIRHGLVLLGAQGVRHWVSLTSLARLGAGLPPEVVASAVARARFAELLAERTPIEVAPLDAFLGGMLSLLEAILDEPAERLLEQISAGPAVRAALLEGSGPLGDLLTIVTAYEQGDLASVTARAEAHGITPGMLFGAYLTALTWVDEQLPAAQ